jgi:hypothetical protein
VGGYTFADEGERVLDGRTLFHYYATGITPPTVPSKPGVGSAYRTRWRGSRPSSDRVCISEFDAHRAWDAPELCQTS